MTTDSRIEKNLKYNWHPFTQMKDHETLPPLLIDRTQGCYLFDKNNNAYLDTISSWWCNIHGHNHPRLVQALTDQAKTLSHTLYAGVTHDPVIDLSEALVSITPSNLTRVFYTDNGSTAVETALKCAIGYFKRRGNPKKTRFISLEHGYHGDTIGCMSVSQVSQFNEEFSALYTPSKSIPVPVETDKPSQLNMKGYMSYCTNVLTGFLKAHHTGIAALIVEPLLQAAGGFRMYPVEFLTQIRDICRDYDVLFIVDEVATGFGRTGKYFASDHSPNLAPDFMCLSKGLTSGTLPFAATMITETIYEAFYSDKKSDFFPHGHTYCANPLGCTLALETLAVMTDENRLDHANMLSEQLKQDIQILTELPGISNARTLGTIAAVDSEALNQPGNAIKYRQAGLDAGLLLRPLGNTIYFMPPLVITPAEYRHVIETVAYILTTVISQ